MINQQHQNWQKGKEKLLDFLGNINNESEAYKDLISIMSRNDERMMLRLRQKEEKEEVDFLIARNNICTSYDTNVHLIT